MWVISSLFFSILRKLSIESYPSHLQKLFYFSLMSVIMFYLLILLLSPSKKSIRLLSGLLDLTCVFPNFSHLYFIYLFAPSSERFLLWFYSSSQKANLNLCPIYYSAYLVKSLFTFAVIYLHFEKFSLTFWLIPFQKKLLPLFTASVQTCRQESEYFQIVLIIFLNYLFFLPLGLFSLCLLILLFSFMLLGF